MFLKCLAISIMMCFLEVLNAQNLDLSKNMGWASASQGGEGGDTIRVTNLKKNGNGSLFAALRTPQKRIIVFDVAGVIDLQGDLITIKDPYLSVLGQSAPSPGITIINGGVGINTHDVIIQHIRVRTGSKINKKPLDALSTTKGAFNVIIDHCSFAWAVDENLTASGPRFDGNTPEEWRKNTSHNITFSNNIIAEGLSHSIHNKGEHSMGSLIHDNVSNMLIVRNLYASNNDRNALFKGGSRSVFLNNYIYNPGVRAVWFALSQNEWKGRPQQTGYLSVVGNVLKLGNDSKPTMHLVYAKYGPLKLYLKDNMVFNKEGNITSNFYEGSKDNLVLEKPIWHSGLKVLDVDKVEKHILENVGARPWDRDVQDQRIIDDVKLKKSRIINTESEVLKN